MGDLRHVQRGPDNAGYGQGVCLQSALHALRQLGHGDGVSHLKVQRREQNLLRGALAHGLWEPAGDKLRHVHRLRQVVELYDGRVLSGRHHGVERIAGHRAVHPVQIAQDLRVRGRYPLGGYHAQIEQGRFVHIPVRGDLHIRLGSPDAGEEAGGQQQQQSDGEKPVEGPPDLPKEVLSVRAVYHSIASTGVGCSLSRIFSCMPFLMVMILSAMGVMAELWVMTITVISRLRHISCSSLRTSLPVA